MIVFLTEIIVLKNEWKKYIIIIWFDFQAIRREKLFSNLLNKNYPAERRRGNLIHQSMIMCLFGIWLFLVSAPWVDTKMNLQLLIYKLFNDYRLLTNNLYFGYYPLFVVISIILKSLFLVFQWNHPFPLFIISQSYRIVNKSRRSFNPAAI